MPPPSTPAVSRVCGWLVSAGLVGSVAELLSMPPPSTPGHPLRRHNTPTPPHRLTEEPMISLVTLIEFFESIFASIKRRNAEKAAVDAAKTGRLVDDGKAAVADIDAELAKAGR
jgi:hypothetical protein